jgi:uncharacterized membrane protein
MSKVTVAGHSAHAIINDWPIALFSTSLVYDILYRLTNNEKFDSAGKLTQIGALGTGTFAAVTGVAEYSDLRRNGKVGDYANIHASLNGVAFSLALGSFFLRRKNPSASLAMSGLVTGLTIVSAWYGDEMVYGEGVRVRNRRMKKDTLEIKIPGDDALADTLRNPFAKGHSHANQSSGADQIPTT